jgi:hypothetical protein
MAGDATSLEVPPSDLIYVSAAVVEPLEQWLTALRLGGRLIFPWRPTADVPLAMLVRRVMEGFEARPLMSSWFIPCAGASSHKGNSLALNLPPHSAFTRFTSPARGHPMTAPSQSTSIVGSPVHRCPDHLAVHEHGLNTAFMVTSGQRWQRRSINPAECLLNWEGKQAINHRRTRCYSSIV